MRKVTFGVANSLDNYIARKDNGVDWLQWSDEVGAITGEFWKTIDTVLMGRKTYEIAAASGMASDSDDDSGMKSYIFSRTMKEAPKGAEIVSENAAEFVRDLKGREGKGICVMGGGELARSLFDANVIDEVAVNIHPVLLGSGIPLFHELQRQIDLELVENKVLSGGCVLLTYRVKN
jgi:dihydrofolate reductase